MRFLRGNKDGEIYFYYKILDGKYVDQLYMFTFFNLTNIPYNIKTAEYKYNDITNISLIEHFGNDQWQNRCNLTAVIKLTNRLNG